MSASRHILFSVEGFESVAVDQLRPLARAFIELALQLMADEKTTETEDEEAA